MVSLAWLIENRRSLHSLEASSVLENSQLFCWFGNRVVVTMLSDLPTALRSETLVRNDFRTIWDDLVLNRAHEASGGVPQVNFNVANALVPEELRQKLGEMMAPH